MEILFKVYDSFMYYAWYILNLPLILFYFALLKFSFLFQQWYLDKNTIPTPIIKYFYRLDSYILKDFYTNMPESFITWINPHLDQQTKEEYMKALTPGKLIRYVSKVDLEETKKDPTHKSSETIFLLKPLTVSQQAELRDNMYNVSGQGKARKEKFKTGTSEVDALKVGLAGWENFKHEETGADVQFEKNNVQAMLELIPADVRSELAAKIRGEAELDEGEE
jgi:hypothetical protein